jgi:hypothetical protein
MLRFFICGVLGMRMRFDAFKVVDAIAAYHTHINRVAADIEELLVDLCKLHIRCWTLSMPGDCAVMPLLLLPQLQHQYQIHPFRRL